MIWGLMSNLFNIIGDWGESAIRTETMRPIDDSVITSYPRFLFRSQFLGEKAETFDFIVYLLGYDRLAVGPYFFLQVKSTEKAPSKRSCPAPFSAKDVKRALSFKSPSYVAAADLSLPTAAIYIKGLSHSRTTGLSSINRKSDFRLDSVKIAVYDEVRDFHEKKSGKFVSKVG